MVDSYYVFQNGNFDRMPLEKLAKSMSLPRDIPISTYSNDGTCGDFWSARLSTGLFGLTSCEAGNRGPKKYNEVILASGDEGLNKFVDLGFIPCPSCKPEKVNGFWDKIQNTVNSKYGISTLEEFVDKKVLVFDARRVNWEELLPIVGKTPNRLYVPNNLSKSDLFNLNRRFVNAGFMLPPTGYYDSNAPNRFTEYKIPTSRESN